MLFGFQITGPLLAAGGITLFTLLVIQVLVGLRKIKFPTKVHFKIHRWIGYTMLVIAVIHGTGALAFLGII